ncbi:GntR family transcriptional repressor for pyruvate dehydrogenase complex [Fontibacillus solani]|uniref:GntR family transcriptional repressor for pyruvate dehydrogenase complex n=1 Tax=Fontibacillus solani TaxID=1572857 RepID=A0A7W3XT28_9BACL|nr:FadR/GntR family transcriptional regulator [Fontibacillus solani]MBA9087170.1 GntR family transcriptional repressor for pyruvate dehydrogenase complex [Fontibacillus solani]
MQPIKVETEKGHEIVQRVILSQIEEGLLQPGQKLPSVVDLSTSFGVGRSTIREALSALKATGWIDVKHGGGTFVSKVLPTSQGNSRNPFEESENVREILEVRIWLESGSASFAAQRRNDQDLERLKLIIEQMEQALEMNNTQMSEQADIEFHLAIAAASHNELLNTLMSSLTFKLTETIGKTRQLWFYEDKSSSTLLLQEHQSIYDAILAQNSELASQLIQAHLYKVKNVLKHGAIQDEFCSK